MRVKHLDDLGEVRERTGQGRGDGRRPVAKRQAVWVRVKVLSAQEKAEIAAKCGRFIEDTLKPRFLPEVRPTEFNYPVDLIGRWRGDRFSGDWRAGLGRSLCSLLARSFVCECHTISAMPRFQPPP